MTNSQRNMKPILVKKYLPHNFLAEKTVLTCLIENSQAVEIIKENLLIEAFYFKNHQEVYKAILLMYEKQMPIDILTLTTFLQENGMLAKIGGIKVLLELSLHVPSLLHFEEYVRLVKDKFLRRSLIKLGYQIINAGYITNTPVEKILTNLEQEIFGLTAELKTKTTINSADLLHNIFFELKEKFLNPKLPGLTSGFYSLDSMTQGFQKSDLIILAGRPSTGKTAFSLNISLNVLKNSKLPILFFSLEMSKEQIMYRLLAIETNINQIRLKNGKLYQNDWIKLNKIIKILSKLPFFIDDSPNLSVQNIRLKVKTIILEQTNIGLIIIDYLQLMQASNTKNENRVQELSQITRSLKAIAREFSVPIIALSQLSRNVENRMDQKPILSDLRESGSIEQDADLVLMLYRSKLVDFDSSQPSQLTELIIAKQRNGPIGTTKLRFNEKQTKFSDFEET